MVKKRHESGKERAKNFNSLNFLMVKKDMNQGKSEQKILILLIP